MHTTPIVCQCDNATLTGSDVVNLYDPGFIAMTHGWWIYTRDIAASKIQVPLTRAQIIQACDWQIDGHPDAEGREAFEKTREQFINAPCEHFLFQNGECFQLKRAA